MLARKLTFDVLAIIYFALLSIWLVTAFYVLFLGSSDMLRYFYELY